MRSILAEGVKMPPPPNQPQSKGDLQRFIKYTLESNPPSPGDKVNFNWIDISKVDDLSDLFAKVDYNPVVNKWKVSHVKDMSGMFACSNFNGDLSNWEVSKDTNMRWMFADCPLEKLPKWYNDK